MFSRERHAIIAVGVDGGGVSGEDRGLAGETKGVAKGVGMSQLPAVRERTVGSSGGPIRIAAMPKRPGQHDISADPNVLTVVKGEIAVLVGPIQRRGRFEMRQGCRIVAGKDQRPSEGAMGNQERGGGRLRLGERQEVGGVLKRGCNRPAVEGRDPKPEKHGEMERAPN